MYKQHTNTYFTEVSDLSPSSSPSPSHLAPSSPLYPSVSSLLLSEDREREKQREKEGREGGWDGGREERGKEGVEEGPYPPVQIWRPPPHRWYQKQAVGKTIGKFFLIGGGSALYAYFKDVTRKASVSLPRKIIAKIRPNPWLLAAGIFCVGTGIYLHCVKYLRDPKAIMKYRKRIFAPTTTFQSVVDEFGWKDLLVIATKEELCYKLYQEMQSVRGLYQICSIYKVNNLRAYLKYDIMRAIDVEARWEYDVTRAAEGTGPELGIVVQECGEFLLTASRMQADKIRESLEKDPTMVGSNFVEIFTKFESSIRRIFKKGFISTEFLRQKLLTQLNTDPTFKFSLIAKHRWVVDCLCTPPEIALAFRAARENCSCIVTFLDLYWTWPIEAYQSLIIPDELELAKLKQIHDEAQAFNHSIQNDLAHAAKRYHDNTYEATRTKEKKIEAIDNEANRKIRDLQLHPPADGGVLAIANAIYKKQTEELEKVKEEDRAVQRKEKQAKEDTERNAERRKEEKKMELHKEWRSFLAQRRYSNPSSTHIPSYTPMPPPYAYAAPSAPPM